MANSFSEKIVNCCFGHRKTLDASVSQTEIAGIYDSLSNKADLQGLSAQHL